MVRFTLITCHPLENKFSDYITSKHESGQTKLILDKEHKKVFQCHTDPHPTMFAENRSHTQWSVRLNYLEVQWHITHVTFLRIRPTVSDGWPLTGTEECYVTQEDYDFLSRFFNAWTSLKAAQFISTLCPFCLPMQWKPLQPFCCETPSTYLWVCGVWPGSDSAEKDELYLPYFPLDFSTSQLVWKEDWPVPLEPVNIMNYPL